ncbi:hypothetical protein GGI05_001462, partial [Coemansia sp. RSA 2603]
MLRATRLLRLNSAGLDVKVCLVSQRKAQYALYSIGSTDGSDPLQSSDATKEVETPVSETSAESESSKQEKKKRQRLQFMAVREPSEALRRMTQMISNNQQPQDAGGEIESFRFTTNDLIHELPAYRAKSLGSKAAAEASLAIATIEER